MSSLLLVVLMTVVTQMLFYFGLYIVYRYIIVEISIPVCYLEHKDDHKHTRCTNSVF